MHHARAMLAPRVGPIHSDPAQSWIWLIGFQAEFGAVTLEFEGRQVETEKAQVGRWSTLEG